MEIERLPPELLTRVISLTCPQDACRVTGVSRVFHAAADSEVIWSCFLRGELPRRAKKELPGASLSKKGLFRRLAAQPALLPIKFVIRRQPCLAVADQIRRRCCLAVGIHEAPWS